MYHSKVRSAGGKGSAIQLGGNGTDTDGCGPVIRNEGYWAFDAGSTTLTAQQHSGVITMTPTAASTLTTLTGAQLDAAFPGIPIGANWDLMVVNLAALTHALTLTAGASGVTVVDGAVAATKTQLFRFYKTAAATYIARPVQV